VAFVNDLLTHTHAKARRVHLVIDNLNIHSRSASSVVNAWTGVLNANADRNARLKLGSRPATLLSEPSGGRSRVRTRIRSSVDASFRNLRVDAPGAWPITSFENCRDFYGGTSRNR
jgi:hypothetical protein